MQTKTDEISAADEHRYGVAHLSNFISLSDLIEQLPNTVQLEPPFLAKQPSCSLSHQKMRISKSLNYTRASFN